MSKLTVKLNVNGIEYNVDVKPYWTLLKVIREELGLKGTKYGCGTGECGACTVILDGRAVHSCLIPAAQAEGKKIITIEGISSGEKLHPIQEAFIDEGAVDCGFCTPGMILAAKSLLDEKPNPTEEEVRRAISGNLCRCTGYFKPVKAILKASEALRINSSKSMMASSLTSTSKSKGE